MQPTTTVDANRPVTTTSGPSSAEVPRQILNDPRSPRLDPSGASPEITPGPSFAGRSLPHPAIRVRTRSHEIMGEAMKNLADWGVTALRPHEFLFVLQGCREFSEAEVIDVLRQYDTLLHDTMPLLGTTFLHEIRTEFPLLLGRLHRPPALRTVAYILRDPTPEAFTAAEMGAVGLGDLKDRVVRDFANTEHLLTQVNHFSGLADHHKAQLIETVDDHFLALLNLKAPAARGPLARSRLESLGPAIDAIQHRLPLPARATLMCQHYEQVLDDAWLDLACRVADVTSASNATALLRDIVRHANLSQKSRHILVLKVAEKVHSLDGADLLGGLGALAQVLSGLEADPRVPGLVQALRASFNRVAEKVNAVAARAAAMGEPSPTELLGMAWSLKHGSIRLEDTQRLMASLAAGQTAHWPFELKDELMMASLKRAELLRPEEVREGLVMVAITYRTLAGPAHETVPQLNQIMALIDPTAAPHDGHQARQLIADAGLPVNVKAALGRLLATQLGRWQAAAAQPPRRDAPFEGARQGPAG